MISLHDSDGVERKLFERLTDRRLLVGVCLAVFLFTSLFGSAHRRAWSDEGWFSSPAYNLAYHGFMGTTVLESEGRNLPGLHERTYWVLPLYLVVQAGWYRVAGHELIVTRGLNLLLVLLAVAALYSIAAELTKERTTPTLAAILFLLEYNILDASTFARPELLCLSLGLAGIASYFILRSKNLTAGLAAGNAFICLSGLTHPNGILYFAALATCVLMLDRSRLSMSIAAASAAPYLLFGGLWLGYVLQDWTSFVAQLTSNSIERNQFDWNPFVIVWRELYERYFFAYGLRSPSLAGKLKAVVLFSYFAALAGLVFTKSLRQSRPAAVALSLCVVVFAIQSVFNQKLAYYVVHIVPWLCLALAVWLGYLWRLGRTFAGAALAWVIVLCLLQPAGIVLRAVTRDERDPMSAAVEFVQERAPNAELIMGSAAFIYDFDFDRRLLDDNYLGADSGKRADVILIEEIYQANFDGWQHSRPDDAARIAAILAEYEEVYDSRGYRVYVREGFELAN